MKCFYHNDADGKCSGFWVFQCAGMTDIHVDCEFIEMSYENPFPIDTICPNEQIYIVDYSISPDEMRELLKITTDIYRMLISVRTTTIDTVICSNVVKNVGTVRFRKK